MKHNDRNETSCYLECCPNGSTPKLSRIGDPSSLIPSWLVATSCMNLNGTTSCCQNDVLSHKRLTRCLARCVCGGSVCGEHVYVGRVCGGRVFCVGDGDDDANPATQKHSTRLSFSGPNLSGSYAFWASTVFTCVNFIYICIYIYIFFFYLSIYFYIFYSPVNKRIYGRSPFTLLT